MITPYAGAMLTLTIDAARWRGHLNSVMEQVPGLVPVAKGNGYGFGNARLASEAAALGADALAVGVAGEAEELLEQGFSGTIVVLNPWRPTDTVATALLSHDRIITTVSRLEDLAAVRAIRADARVQVEVATSMLRHGLAPAEITRVDPGSLRFEGWSVHLPATGSLEEATTLARAAVAHLPGQVWVSHLSVADYTRFRQSFDARMRVGTRLWLGDAGALRTTARIVDVHPVARGTRVGYHQVKLPRDGFIVAAGGGTAHGIALAAPVPQRTLRQRVTTAAEGLLGALGRSLSPFTIGGRKRAFAEPPHMHSSMLFVPGADPFVSIGDEVPVTCRMTTTGFDRIELV